MDSHQAHATGKPPHAAHASHDKGSGHYGRFLLMLLLSFIAMYVIMYAMVDTLGNAVPNLNQFYMAGLMTAPMAVLELLLMGKMYPDRRKNALLLGLAVVALAGFWFAIRAQAAIGNREFLKSMIPHHAGAILMCEQAELTDREVQALCQGIVRGQTREIAQMRALLDR
jgi:hypothetical protein